MCSGVQYVCFVILVLDVGVQPVAMHSVVFCIYFSFTMFIVDAIGDHTVEVYSIIGLVAALYVESIVSLPCLVEKGGLLVEF